MKKEEIFDVIIIGGSYAGLSAAMALGRSLRKVLIIDSGEPCNRQTPHAHNFLTHDGEPPLQIATVAKAQVMRYPTISFVSGRAAFASRQQELFIIQTEEGTFYTTRRLLLATGVVDQMPAIPGFAASWGVSLLHCPYCHGYEIRNQQIGLLGNGEAGFELTKLIGNWSRNLTLFTNGKSTLLPEQTTQLTRRNIPILETEIMEIKEQNGYVEHLRFKDNTTVAVDAIFARVPFTQSSNLAGQLNCQMTETGLIKTDEFGKTSVAGLFAAGDNSTFMRSIAVAVANGTKVGAWINRELIEEDFVKGA